MDTRATAERDDLRPLLDMRRTTRVETHTRRQRLRRTEGTTPTRRRSSLQLQDRVPSWASPSVSAPLLETSSIMPISSARIRRYPKRNRFWEHVQKTDTCWLWTGPQNNKGYGQFGKITAHRRSAQLARMEMPPRFHVHHTCGVKLCVRPDHLLISSPSDHRTLHRSPVPLACVHGHDLTGYNLKIRASGYWLCRECDRLRKKRSRRRTLSSP
jgi:HNH endonuclease